jgi:hypothetical protein
LICADGRGRRHYEGAVGGARPEDFDGHFHTTLKGARISPRLLQQPHPRSTSGAAQPKPGKAKHSAVHPFWGGRSATTGACRPSSRSTTARQLRQGCDPSGATSPTTSHPSCYRPSSTFAA